MRELMSANRSRQIALLLALFVVVVGTFAYGFLVSRFRIAPYSSIVWLEKNAARAMSVLRDGKDGYVRAQLSQQMSPQQAGLAPQTKTIETAVLPISVAEVSLTTDEAIPAGAGALSVIGDRVVVMDRLGKLYRYENHKLITAQIPPVPNGLESFILRSRNLDLNRDTFRSHSIAYDARRGTLFASFEKYLNPRQNAFCVAAIALDPRTSIAVGAWRTIYQSKATDAVGTWGLAGGGKLLVNADVLYFAIGDYGFDRTGP